MLAIENDDRQGDAATFKRIYRVDLAQPQAAGRMSKQLQVDLLSIRDPRRLGPQDASVPFRFPFVTIEAVHTLDARTLLVVNDNNFPSRGARGADTPNDTEWIWLRLPPPRQE